MTDELEAALRAADTVVFDFDGVLADSEPLHLRSYRELMVADGGGIDEETFRGLIGRKEREIWPAVAGPGRDVDSLAARRGPSCCLAELDVCSQPRGVAGGALEIAPQASNGGLRRRVYGRVAVCRERVLPRGAPAERLDAVAPSRSRRHYPD